MVGGKGHALSLQLGNDIQASNRSQTGDKLAITGLNAMYLCQANIRQVVS